MSEGSASAPSSSTAAPAASSAPAGASTAAPTSTSPTSAPVAAISGKESAEQPTTSLGGSELSAEQMDEALASAEESENSTPSVKKYKVKIDGKEVEVGEDELLSGYQTRKASQKRFEEAAKMKKYADQMGELMKSNPFQALLNMGVDHEQARKLAEDYLIERMEEDTMDPKEKELRAAKKKIEELEGKEKQKKQLEEQEQYAKAKESYGADLEDQIVGALEGSGLPPTSYTVKRVAYYLDRALEHNLDLKPVDVLKYVKQDYEQDLGSFLGGFDGDKILSAVPQPVLDKIRKALVSKVKNKNSPTTPAAVPSPTKTESVAVPESAREDKKDKKKMSMSEFRDWSNKIK